MIMVFGYVVVCVGFVVFVMMWFWLMKLIVMLVLDEFDSMIFLGVCLVVICVSSLCDMFGRICWLRNVLMLCVLDLCVR